MIRALLLLLLLCVCVACGGVPPAGEMPDDPDPTEEPDGDPSVPSPADPLHDTIAYVTGDGDAIRLIDPDGGGDRPLWEHGQVDEHDTYEVWDMAWNPSGTELAFTSTHENWCSLYAADVFAVASDGSRPRRITQSPACGDLSAYPTGTVIVPVENSGFDSFSGFLYFQGAPSIQPVNLPPGGTGTVVFEDVADLGTAEDELQVGAIVYGNYRDLVFSALADVVPGDTVTTGTVGVYPPSASWEARSATWSPDGERVGHLLNFGSPWAVDAAPAPREFGVSLLAEDATVPDFGSHLAWGPTEATADRLLYAGTMIGGSTSIWLASEGDSGGETVVSFESFESIKGLAWLPDGSGFAYSVTEGDFFGEDRASNLFVHDLATGTTERVTDFVGEFVGQIAVAPDGQRFAFERAASLDELATSPVDPDLWLVARDGSGLGLLVTDAYAPAWSR